MAGNLILGGYDASRFLPSNISFAFAGDVSRDLVVGIQSITVNDLNTSRAASFSLLPNPILSFIDAGVSQIWLPIEACNLFESTFGLEYDPITELYLVNQTIHAALVAQNASITFTIATDISGTDRVPIVFPYAAFDLQLTPDYPSINETTSYFPIRRAANETQYTLGRTFLQEAYVVADYERFNFSVNQCTFSETQVEDIQTINPTPNTTASAPLPTSSLISSVSNSKGIKVGIAVAVAVAILILCSAIFIIRHRRGRRNKKAQSHIEQPEQKASVPELDLGSQKLGELPEGLRRPPELEDSALQELQGCSADHELEHEEISRQEKQMYPTEQKLEGELGPPFELPTGDMDDTHGVPLNSMIRSST